MKLRPSLHRDIVSKILERRRMGKGGLVEDEHEPSDDAFLTEDMDLPEGELEHSDLETEHEMEEREEDPRAKMRRRLSGIMRG